MRIITLEDHFDTQLCMAQKPPPNELRLRWFRDRSKHLGHDIEAEIVDVGASRIAAMDATGIDLQVLSLTTPGAQAFEGELAIRIAADANDRMHAAVKTYPGRFRAFAALPTAEPDAAVRELDRAAREAPYDLAYRLDLAVLYDRTGHGNEALILYRQLLQAAAEDGASAPPLLSSIQQRADYLAARLSADADKH